MKIYFSIFLIIIGCVALKRNTGKINPPGTIQINDTLFVDQTEVANVHWREYLLSFEIQKDFIGLSRALPDTMVWADKTSDSLGFYQINPLTEVYLRHPSFNMYPLVGVTNEQAIDFCKWRTYAANAITYWRENKVKPQYDSLYNIPIKFYYRLPTKQEWEMLAAGNLSVEKFPYGYNDVYTYKGRRKNANFNCNYYPEYDTFRNKASFYTAPVDSYFPNSFGCRNMIGNVAEMILEKGIAKGGGWVHSIDRCKITIDHHYTKPEKWLGFRCVAVKLKESLNYLDYQRQY